ncbi:hypothetical protein F5Y17DRAFT_274939 [Xylariaceae sp. FL0594]|nr:hypothetical protein F5Y17DRAFT_274939 [Xylariaceae sp. FL0594]
MSDLKFIMDMEDDGDPMDDKYPGQPSLSGSALGPNPSSASPTTSTTNKSDVNHRPPTAGLTAAYTRRRGPLSRSSRATAATWSSDTALTSVERPSSPPPLSPPSGSLLVERTAAEGPQSTGLLDNVNDGSRSSLSTMAPTNRSNMSSRPMPNAAGEGSLPVKLTPITGRVSRAKKGVPVHVCEKCIPHRTFTRAEHLRRHDLGHGPAAYACSYPGCDKQFVRQDLYLRHLPKHDQEEKAGTDGSARAGRRSSRPSVGGNTPPVAYMSSPAMHDTQDLPSKVSNSTAYGADAPTYQASSHGGSGGNAGQGATSPSSHSHRSHPEDNVNYSWSPAMGYPLTSMGEGSFSGVPFSDFPHHPRTVPTLQIPEPIFPERLRHESHWPSSASNSPYSTPTPDGPYIGDYNSPSLDIYIPHQPQYPSSPELQIYQHGFLASYPEDVSGFYDLQTHPFSVRSPTPPTVVLSAQTAENLVTFAHSVPAPPAVRGRRKTPAALLSLYRGAGCPAAEALVPARLNAIPRYLDAYWKRFDTFFPLVHRCRLVSSADDFLRCAMAAVGSQFFHSEEDRTNGELLYVFAVKESQKARPEWNIEVMQAILLCEFYGRFRGLKPTILPSEPFQSIYSRMASPHPLDSYDPFINSNHQDWQDWITAESRRRLLAACFVLDVHSSMYYEHSPLYLFHHSTTRIPLTMPSERLWEARDSNSWEALTSSDPSLLNPAFLGDEKITVDVVASAPPFDAAIYLASEALRLPRRSHNWAFDATSQLDLSSLDRIRYLFPASPVANTYLALHFTPLQDLLAVSGDTWRFATKVLKPGEAKQARINVRSWSSSDQAGAASIFAAKALLGFLDTGDDDAVDDGKLDDRDQTDNSRAGTEWNRSNISDYWALYICAVIFWAVAYRSIRTGRGLNLENCGSKKIEVEATTWLKQVASLSEPHNVLHDVQGHWKVLSIISMVRKRLEDEAVGCKGKLLLDSITVLEKLEANSNKERF